MSADPSAFQLDPALLVRGDGRAVTIRTLDDALAFIESHPLAEASANRQGVIFRLHGATTTGEKAEAADAFRQWAEAAGVLIGTRSAGE